MGKRKIFTGDASCLYKQCRPVEKFDAKLAALLDDMAETMYDANGVGLAGPQVGILRRSCGTCEPRDYRDLRRTGLL